MRKASLEYYESTKALETIIRDKLKSCDDEAEKSKLNEILASLHTSDDDDAMPIEQWTEHGIAEWNRLKDDVGFDRRGNHPGAQKRGGSVQHLDRAIGFGQRQLKQSL